MTCRRKTKKERELAADINKAYGIFCQKHSSCYGCEYDEKVDCKKSIYVRSYENGSKFRR